MNDEQTNTPDTQRTQTNSPMEAPLSIVQEAQKVRDEIKAENDRRERILADEQKLRANELLGGTTGGRVEPTPAPRLSNIEYAEKLKRGEVNPLKEDDISID